MSHSCLKSYFYLLWCMKSVRLFSVLNLFPLFIFFCSFCRLFMYHSRFFWKTSMLLSAKLFMQRSKYQHLCWEMKPWCESYSKSVTYKVSHSRFDFGAVLRPIYTKNNNYKEEIFEENKRGTHCRLLRKPVLRSSISSMGEEEDRKELSDGMQEGLLLSLCSTGRELGLSSRLWESEKRI